MLREKTSAAEFKWKSGKPDKRIGGGDVAGKVERGNPFQQRQHRIHIPYALTSIN
jgi:hypothetical protein